MHASLYLVTLLNIKVIPRALDLDLSIVTEDER